MSKHKYEGFKIVCENCGSDDVYVSKMDMTLNWFVITIKNAGKKLS